MYAVYWFHKALLLIFNSNDVIALLQYSHSSTDFKWLILSLSNTTFHNSIPHFVHLHGISLFWLFVELRCISNYFSFESTILIRFVFGVYLVMQMSITTLYFWCNAIAMVLHIYVANIIWTNSDQCFFIENEYHFCFAMKTPIVIDVISCTFATKVV